MARQLPLEGRGQRTGRHTLRITIQQTEVAVEITLDGRVAGPWVAELREAWKQISMQLRNRAVTIDLRNVTYADAQGKRVLSEIVTQSSPRLLSSTPWTQYLVEEITPGKGPNKKEEAGYGIHA